MANRVSDDSRSSRTAEIWLVQRLRSVIGPSIAQKLPKPVFTPRTRARIVSAMGVPVRHQRFASRRPPHLIAAPMLEQFDDGERKDARRQHEEDRLHGLCPLSGRRSLIEGRSAMGAIIGLSRSEICSKENSLAACVRFGSKSVRVVRRWRAVHVGVRRRSAFR